MTTIRPATSDDAEMLAHLAECTFRDTFATADNHADLDRYCATSFGPEIQQQEILDPNCVTLLAEIEDQPVAFAQVLLHSPKACLPVDRSSELRRLYVSQEWHGRGVARDVMTHVMATVTDAGAGHIWLGVWEHNPRAIAFYRKYGFEVVGEHVFQFGNDPQRDLVMMATVKDVSMP